jgi:uncharacterized protein (TIGR03435 family)
MIRTTIGRLLTVVLTAVASREPLVLAQAPPAAPTFEVASVKPNQSGGAGMSVQILPGGRYMASNATLRALVQASYDFEFQDFQILGGGGWIDAEHFDIDARAGGNPPPRQVSAMVRTLLADRFKLSLQRETRELPIYALVSARSDGTLGSQIKPSSGQCASGPLPTGPAPASGRAELPRCGIGSPSRTTGGRMEAMGVTLDQLAKRLQFYVERVVVNRTGLAATFDLDLEFTGDARRPASPDVSPATDRPADAGVSLFTALQEQLGLKLEPQRGPVDVLVIVGAERPTPN